jgi:carbamoyl-phosphate synthase / aspartate carbamoyltransferase
VQAKPGEIIFALHCFASSPHLFDTTFHSTHSTMAERESESMMALEVKDGDRSIRFCEGTSFGAHRSAAGELVFQTGMVGYPESITDPSYRGQILVIAFPLVGNYGVPSREDKNAILKDIPAHFESSEIHIAGLIVASYSGEDYSHYLATSSLGTWLKEQNVPAIYGVDTRALTKRIREKGSMLGRLLMQTGTQRIASNHLAVSGTATPNGLATPAKTPLPSATNGTLSINGVNGVNGVGNYFHRSREVPVYEEKAWDDPNIRNLVADGKLALPARSHSLPSLIHLDSLNARAKDLLSKPVHCVASPIW